MAVHEEKWLLEFFIHTFMCQKCPKHFMNNIEDSQPSVETLTKLKEHLLLKHKETYNRLQDLSNKNLLQCYNSKLKCQNCYKDFENNTDSFQPSKETLIELREHLCNKHKKRYDPERNTEYIVIKEREVPVRSSILKHYSLLKGDVVKCKNCFQIIYIGTENTSSCRTLYDHLESEHGDKYTKQIDKKVAWYWDHITELDKLYVQCNYCNKKYEKYSASMKQHMKIHKKTCPTVRIAMDDVHDLIDTDMSTSTRKEKVQETSDSLRTDMPKETEGTKVLNENSFSAIRSVIMAEHEEKWVLQHYICTYKCQVCSSHLVNNINNFQPTTKTLTKLKEHLSLKHPKTCDGLRDLSNNHLLQYYSSKLKCPNCSAEFQNNPNTFQPSNETLIKLKLHLCNQHNKKYDFKPNTEYNVIKEIEVPVHSSILEHYSYLKGRLVKCKNCFEIIRIYKEDIKLCEILYTHLKRYHGDKYIEKISGKVAWYYHHFTEMDKFYMKCNYCKQTYQRIRAFMMHNHLKKHKKTCPVLTIDTDDTSIDTHIGTSTKKKKLQEDPNDIPLDLSKNTGVTEVINDRINNGLFWI
ncbi:PREDICTED: uncharacterized protein LOC105569899 isoform X2 [Vollenhovia emeryi]|uniref:uncharacterized protein LOC105569899 isoform X2 n=1 Tax=Vollenhovia emeryi TaxID=411798 RepID=UPI0005F3C645|nr:PREDICTED: uncharacterized protein LOC105569899 isoform X2 [Vollenhovia emeryi]